jgi:hypothetical protein
MFSSCRKETERHSETVRCISLNDCTEAPEKQGSLVSNRRGLSLLPFVSSTVDLSDSKGTRDGNGSS